MKTTVRNVLSAFLIFGAASVMTTGAWAADAAAGATLYASKCRSCHGPDGTGNKGMAAAMKADLNLTNSSDDAIKTAATSGVGKMKPVAGISGADLDNLTAAIHAMKK